MNETVRIYTLREERKSNREKERKNMIVQREIERERYLVGARYVARAK